MSDIKRYDPDIEYPRSYGEPVPSMYEWQEYGGWVKYEDHVAVVEGLKREIERLTHRALDLHIKIDELEESIEAQKDAGWEMSGEDC